MASTSVPNSVLGIMSGTSLDGVDFALCTFWDKDSRTEYEILCTETISLPKEWLKILANPFTLTAEELAAANIHFGSFLGQEAKKFLERNNQKVPLIASHGHTLFHNPAAGYTFQLGHGAAIANMSGIDTVSDFRTGDVALGGQGAPLVPLGDEILFGQYDGCLNLGGFSNISLHHPVKGRVGFDISPANFVLNELAQRTGKSYDKDGEMATEGHILNDLLEKLNTLSFYSEPTPKSLGAEWVKHHVFPLLTDNYTPADLACTFCEHIAIQIARITDIYRMKSLLCTGGGVKNKFLIGRIHSLTGGITVIPDEKTIDYKEALIFALLGHLRKNEKTNILQQVTGARLNSCSGAYYKASTPRGY